MWGGPRRRTSDATRRAPFRWNREASGADERRRVFCMSLGDFWDNQAPDQWRTEALNIIRQCRHLDWLVLTKRPQNIVKMLPTDWGSDGWPHVWLGATVENMAEARRRIPILLSLPARVRWLSVAPRFATMAWARHRLDGRRWRDWLERRPLYGTRLGARPSGSVRRYRRRYVLQTNVEAEIDPSRPAGARISGGLKPH